MTMEKELKLNAGVGFPPTVDHPELEKGLSFPCKMSLFLTQSWRFLISELIPCLKFKVTLGLFVTQGCSRGSQSCHPRVKRKIIPHWIKFKGSGDNKQSLYDDLPACSSNEALTLIKYQFWQALC